MSNPLRAFPLYVACCIALAPSVRAQTLTTGWQKVDGIQLFYREGGPRDAPTIVFLPGNPLSSIQYVDVMQQLVTKHSMHVISVDYPSFGYSDAPSPSTYRYTFDHLASTVENFLRARGVTRYGLFMQDYGVPVGFRLISDTPDSVTTIVVQNGVIHLDGFPSAQDENGALRRHWRNRDAAVDKRRVAAWSSLTFPTAGWDGDDQPSPDVYLLMISAAQRPGVVQARNDLWFDYGSNVALYPKWQALLRKLKIPVLVIWGSKDDFFTVPGAVAYLRDAPQAEVHIIDASHFATLSAPDKVSRILGDFVDEHRQSLERVVTASH